MSDPNDRGPKTPRTLFSLGRPGAKGEPAADEPVETIDTDELEYDYVCGSCAAPLPNGATVCEACGTPVALPDEVDAEAYGDDDDLELLEEDDAELPAEEVVAEDEPVTDEPLAEEVAAADEPVVEDEPVTDEPLAEDEPVAEEAVAEDEALAEEVPAEEPVAEEVAAADLADVPVADGEPVLDLTAIEEEPGTVEDAPFEELPGDTPAAVLYADPSVAEPLPPEPEGDWGIAAPVIGTAAGAFVAEELAGDAALAEEVGADAPTAVQEAVGADGTAPGEVVHEPVMPAAVAAPASGSLPYGSGPVESSEKKGKAGILIGAGAAVIVVGVIVGVLMAGGSKNEKKAGDVQTAQQATTTTTAKAGDDKGDKDKDKGGTSTTTASTTTTSTAADSSSTTASTDTTVTTTATTVPVTVTVGPTVPQTVTVATPPPTIATTTTLAPGRLTASPPSGSSVSLAKVGGQTQIVVTNVGGRAAQCSLNAGPGLTIVNPCGSIAPGASATVTVKTVGTFEGNTSVNGLLEGSGSYTLNVKVLNG